MRFLIRRVDKIPLDYTNLFIGVIIKSIHIHQQKLDIYLQDIKNNKGTIKIGTILDKDHKSMDFYIESALKMLNNEDFCFAHYRDLLNEEMKDE